ncbi:MAG: hypothetical protein ACRD11_00925 [Terriglobia bacterium]
MRRHTQVMFVCVALFGGSLFISRRLPAQNRATSEVTISAQAKLDGADSDIQNSELVLLKQKIQSQQQQIEQMKNSLARQKQLLEHLVEREEKTAAATSPAPSAAVGNRTVAAPVEPAGGETPLVASTAPPSVIPDWREGDSLSGKQNPEIPNSPIAVIPLKVGHSTLTPFGFVDATAFFRSRNLGIGIGAAFGSLPFSNTVPGRLSETRFSAQNSRFGLQYDSQFGANKVRGYMETDFLGAQPANAFVTSNSDSLRLRLYWVDLTRGKFEFLAGQSWSLLTPGREGISPMPSDLFYTQDMDTNYQVGLTWARQVQFRFVYHADPHITAAVSLENPEQYVGSAVILPSGFNPSQVSTGSSTATPNSFPDVIGKLAFDGNASGHHAHLDLAGLLSSFKTYNAATNSTSSVEGGGGSINANFELFRSFRLFATSFYSDGGGRYLYGLGPDFIVRPDSTASLVRSEAGIGGFEFQATHNTMFYGYYGRSFFGRNYSVIPSPANGASTYVGYGFPGSSSAANRAIQEATFGIIQTFWKNTHYGALQLITQYSYLTRTPWYVAAGGPKNANLSEAYADIRYVVP